MRRDSMTMRRSIGHSIVVVALLAGCAGRDNRPLIVPGAEISIQQFAGTPLTGSRPAPIDNSAFDGAVSARVRMLALREMPAESLPPLARSVRLISVSQGVTPLRPFTRLTQGARFGANDDAAAVVQELEQAGEHASLMLRDVTLAIPAGTTAEVQASEPDAARSIALAISRPAQDEPNPVVQLSLAIEDVVAVDSAEPPAGAAAEPEVAESKLVKERVVLDDLPVVPDFSAVVLVPFIFSQSSAEAVAIVVEVSTASDFRENVESLELARQRIGEATADAARRPDIAPIASDQWAAYSTALRALSDPARRRASLVHLASHTDATLCGDVALVADDAVLDSLGSSIQQHASQLESQSPEALGWLLDRAAIELLTRLHAENTLPVELHATLLIHLGQAARSGGSLEEIGKSLSTRAEFENRVVAENMIYLEDASPAARVRAFNWLRARNRAPDGYDPMASNKARRDALDQALAPATQPSQP